MTVAYDRIDQWLDWGDHTVTVDPIGNKAWIHEGQDSKHRDTAERGRSYRARDVQHLIGLLGGQTTQTTSFFLPTPADLERVPKFPSRRNGSCDVWRGDIRDVSDQGNLPEINQRVREGLPEEQKGMIERQMYRNMHTIGAKISSRAGVPDHGLPSNGMRSS